MSRHYGLPVEYVGTRRCLGEGCRGPWGAVIGEQRRGGGGASGVGWAGNSAGLGTIVSFDSVWTRWQVKSAASSSTSGAGASGGNDLGVLEDSEVGLEQSRAMLVTMILDVGTYIEKDHRDDMNLVLYSGAGGKKA
jgi:hypothetical protein